MLPLIILQPLTIGTKMWRVPKEWEESRYPKRMGVFIWSNATHSQPSGGKAGKDSRNELETSLRKLNIKAQKRTKRHLIKKEEQKLRTQMGVFFMTFPRGFSWGPTKDTPESKNLLGFRGGATTQVRRRRKSELKTTAGGASSSSILH